MRRGRTQPEGNKLVEQTIGRSRRASCCVCTELESAILAVKAAEDRL
jgi:hypothetical protein